MSYGQANNQTSPLYKPLDARYFYMCLPNCAPTNYSHALVTPSMSDLLVTPPIIESGFPPAVPSLSLEMLPFSKIQIQNRSLTSHWLQNHSWLHLPHSQLELPSFNTDVSMIVTVTTVIMMMTMLMRIPSSLPMWIPTTCPRSTWAIMMMMVVMICSSHPTHRYLSQNPPLLHYLPLVISALSPPHHHLHHPQCLLHTPHKPQLLSLMLSPALLLGEVINEGKGAN